MKKTIFYFMQLFFFSFLFSTSFSQPEITSVTYPGSVDLFDMIEIGFEIDFNSGTELNYYDPDEVDVFCTFTSYNDGEPATTEQVIGFYYEGQDRSAIGTGSGPWDRIEQLDANGNNEWRIRFTPRILAFWDFTITVHDYINGTTVCFSGDGFESVASDRKGFIGVSPANNRYFEYSNGGNYMPIGYNIGAA